MLLLVTLALSGINRLLLKALLDFQLCMARGIDWRLELRIVRRGMSSQGLCPLSVMIQASKSQVHRISFKMPSLRHSRPHKVWDLEFRGAIYCLLLHHLKFLISWAIKSRLTFRGPLGSPQAIRHWKLLGRSYVSTRSLIFNMSPHWRTWSHDYCLTEYTSRTL